MSDADARRWAEMAGSGDTQTMSSQAPSATTEQAAWSPPPEPTGGKSRREKRQKPPKVPSASRSRSSSGGSGLGDEGSLLYLGRETKSREQLEREGAEELMSALSVSYNLLHQEVPESASPDDAQRKIEQKLGPYRRDNDPQVPDHPIYSGDALVYYQLRRHYGSPHPGGTYKRSWYPLSGG